MQKTTIILLTFLSITFYFSQKVCFSQENNSENEATLIDFNQNIKQKSQNPKFKIGGMFCLQIPYMTYDNR